MKPPINQARRTNSREPRSPSANPEVVKTPAPIMFATTSALALGTPSLRASSALFTVIRYSAIARSFGVDCWMIPFRIDASPVSWVRSGRLAESSTFSDDLGKHRVGIVVARFQLHNIVTVRHIAKRLEL